MTIMYCLRAREATVQAILDQTIHDPKLENVFYEFVVGPFVGLPTSGRY